MARMTEETEDKLLSVFNSRWVISPLLMSGRLLHDTDYITKMHELKGNESLYANLKIWAVLYLEEMKAGGDAKMDGNQGFHDNRGNE